jgi:hypothetical protein
MLNIFLKYIQIYDEMQCKTASSFANNLNHGVIKLWMKGNRKAHTLTFVICKEIKRMHDSNYATLQ